LSSELDFTKAGDAAPPPPEKVAEAKKEAATGSPELARSGFYVAMARHSAGGRIAPREGDRHSILVVEDDLALSGLVSEVLATEGFYVCVAKNRAEINTEFNHRFPDLILLDVTLPDANGFQILERIRGNPKLAKLPVIMMTGKSEVGDVARGLALNADGYVTKPFKIDALISAVKTVLGLGA
jgi:CheY-like chemotaxis protein